LPFDIQDHEFESNPKYIPINSTNCQLQELFKRVGPSVGLLETAWKSNMPTNWKWEKYGDLVLIPEEPYAKFLEKVVYFLSWSYEDQISLIRILNPHLHNEEKPRLAAQQVVKSDGFRTPNVRLMVGSNTKVHHIELGIHYDFDVMKCMFSSGNITEKIRISRFNCERETVVDLFAGIGYFTLSYLVHAKANHVYACEWNPDAVEALRRGLEWNLGLQWQDRCTLLPGDNRNTCPMGVADRVNLGLLPTAKASFAVAAKALKTPGPGEFKWLHVHANVDRREADPSLTTVKKITCLTKDPAHGLHTHQYQTIAKTLNEVDISSNLVDSDNNCKEYTNLTTLTSNKQFLPVSWVEWAEETRNDFSQLLNEHFRSSVNCTDSLYVRWVCEVFHIERVKSYGPKIDHLVLDLKCFLNVDF